MIKMNRVWAFVAAGGIVCSMLVAAPLLAQNPPPGGDQVGGGSALGGALGSSLGKAAPKALQGATDLNVIIGGLIEGVIGFLGVVLFLYLLYGGYRWMTAGGDSKKVDEARDVMKNAIIGLVIIAAAYAIANFVISSLGNAVGGGPKE